jgi:hypothetical protein
MVLVPVLVLDLDLDLHSNLNLVLVMMLLGAAWCTACLLEQGHTCCVLQRGA